MSNETKPTYQQNMPEKQTHPCLRPRRTRITNLQIHGSYKESQKHQATTDQSDVALHTRVH